MTPRTQAHFMPGNKFTTSIYQSILKLMIGEAKPKLPTHPPWDGECDGAAWLNGFCVKDPRDVVHARGPVLGRAKRYKPSSIVGL